MTGNELVTGNKRKIFQEFRAQRSKYILGGIASKRNGVEREAHAHFLRELLLGKHPVSDRKVVKREDTWRCYSDHKFGRPSSGAVGSEDHSRGNLQSETRSLCVNCLSGPKVTLVKFREWCSPG